MALSLRDRTISEITHLLLGWEIIGIHVKTGGGMYNNCPVLGLRFELQWPESTQRKMIEIRVDREFDEAWMTVLDIMEDYSAIHDIPENKDEEQITD